MKLKPASEMIGEVRRQDMTDLINLQAEVDRYRKQMEISDRERKDAQEDFEHAAHRHGEALEKLNKLQQRNRRTADDGSNPDTAR